ncbi:integral membrane protein [Fusarium mexicanum]|uniref:Integral membrane protein n=1 Tax=Fusarium mexicanum TaxID=751941 RepID=A0A8H5J4Z6_9HYPO|nr:integral membrane protein [Fusarium mexicanum]
MEDKGPMIIAVCWTFTVLALGFVIARLFICAILSNVFVTISVYWGNGKHFDVLNLEQKENTIKWMMAAYVPGIETLGFPKLAVIALLARLLMPSKIHLVVLWTMGIICSTSAFLDFYLAVYPAITLWKLLMPLKKKLILSLALGMGVVCGAIGIVKATGVPTLASQDVSLLQPILEMLKGRNIWSTKKGSGKHQYEDYSRQSGQQQPGIELKDRPRKKVDTYGFTIQAKEGSEENMVDADKVSRTTSSRPESPKEGILRTDQVTIGYDGGKGGPTSAAKRWAAV